jgi:hypothetical protein
LSIVSPEFTIVSSEKGARLSLNRFAMWALAFSVPMLFATPLLAAGEFKAFDGAATSIHVLDARAGHYDYWRVPNIENANALRATLQIQSIAYSYKWKSRATIILRAGNEDATLFFDQLERERLFVASLVKYKGDKMVSRQYLQKHLRLRELIEISVDWTPEGVVTVKAGNSDHFSVTLEHPISGVSLTSASSNAQFTIALGRTDP